MDSNVLLRKKTKEIGIMNWFMSGDIIKKLLITKQDRYYSYFTDREPEA